MHFQIIVALIYGNLVALTLFKNLNLKLAYGLQGLDNIRLRHALKTEVVTILVVNY